MASFNEAWMNTGVDIMVLYFQKEFVELHSSSLPFHMTHSPSGFLEFCFMLNEQRITMLKKKFVAGRALAQLVRTSS